VNAGHRKLCSSAGWGEYIRKDLLPWMLGNRPLGGSVLEIGPGPGLSTDLLRGRARRVTAVETDLRAARVLERRLEDTNVTVVHADATDLPFRRGRFTAGVAMTMLHHVPTREAQDALFAEANRVLRSGCWFVGVDSLDEPGFRGFHRGDVCNPIDPSGLARRLRAAGFSKANVERGDHVFRFAAQAG
jgi:SAM-dependent methyltransferase